ncbi:MAG: ribbon-helix-helix domain-containing protein [Marinomonas foliarum]|uniref:ribbon-helix-helix domain-containing protein n=1 Tax=Marinomonas foliarum TaxID=491950 RepID=UPI003F9A4720
MSNLSKRSTVYFEPAIHQALKMRAASSDVSISELIDEAVRLLMREDQEDLADISERVNEPEMTYEDFQSELKINGKI